MDPPGHPDQKQSPCRFTGTRSGAGDTSMRDCLVCAMLGTITARALAHWGARMAGRPPASAEKIAPLVVDAAFYAGLLLWLCHALSGEPWAHWASWGANARRAHPPCPTATAAFQAVASYSTVQAVLAWASHAHRTRARALGLGHGAAILVLTCAYTAGYTRLGVVLLGVYAVFEPLFLLSRIMHECGATSASRGMLVVSCTVFVPTRLGLFPALAALSLHARAAAGASASERCGLVLLVCILLQQARRGRILHQMCRACCRQPAKTA